MNEPRKSIVPSIEEIDAQIQFHKEQLVILKAYRRTATRLTKRGYQQLPLRPEEPTEA